jgi:hypothetical protein
MYVQVACRLQYAYVLAVLVASLLDARTRLHPANRVLKSGLCRLGVYKRFQITGLLTRNIHYLYIQYCASSIPSTLALPTENRQVLWNGKFIW